MPGEKRKICVVTGTRAEYGLLYWLIKSLHEDGQVHLQLCVTGMHLSPEFGLTYKQIEKDGFHIDKKVECLMSSDTAIGVTKSVGMGVIGFADAYESLKPDLIVVLGDRFEILAAATAGMIANIPIAHCHGGETTEGAFDESIRHSITKMSHLHFTSTEAYRNRVIQLGESPDRTYNVGGLGIENINKMDLLSREGFEESIGFQLGKYNALVTFHPVTLESATAQDQFQNLLGALSSMEDLTVIFTKPNADTGGRVIIQMIDSYVAENPHSSIAFVSLGQLRYLSALQYVDIVVGNSSSGLIEVPSFHKATVNIGDRQRGRTKAASVIDCQPTYEGIKEAMQRALSGEFQQILEAADNPYGNRNASEMILPVLKKTDLSTILKKEFYDLPNSLTV